jgi:hypothetical protein
LQKPSGPASTLGTEKHTISIRLNTPSCSTSSRATRQFEEDVGISSVGLLSVKTEGGPVTYDSERQTFTTRYTHVVYASGFIITREIMDDDQYDIVGKQKAQGLAFAARQTKEIVAANIYNRAFTGTGNPTYGDGSVLLVSNHPTSLVALSPTLSVLL